MSDFSTEEHTYPVLLILTQHGYTFPPRNPPTISPVDERHA
jgi:hypothetical protein